MSTPIKERLEYLRGELRAERISYGELAELQGLASHIDKGDTELLEAAGVPEDTSATTQPTQPTTQLDRLDRLEKFIALIADMKTEDEYGEDLPESEDWTMTLSNLIEMARKIRREGGS